MKILHIAPSYWPAFKMGGPTQSVHVMNRYLVKKGADVTVFTTNAGLEKDGRIKLDKETLMDGVKIFYFSYYGYVHYTFSPRMFVALWKNIKNFDLVHITGVWNFPVSAAAFWARFYKIPYVISPRGSLMKEPLVKKSAFLKKTYLNLISKRDLKNAALIHFTAELEKEEYLESGLPLKKSVIIPNALDVNSSRKEEKEVSPRDFRIKFGIKPDSKVILFLGRISWKKGLDTLIPAFTQVVKAEPRAVLVIAGPDEEGYGKKAKRLIEEQKLNDKDKDKIIFTETLVGATKIAAYQVPNVFVLPSYSENFGMAVVEAMYYETAGTAVVITNQVGISPYIREAEAGIVINKDTNELAKAILEILKNPERAKRMSEKGKKLIESKFSPDKIAGGFIEQYNELLRKQT